MGICCLRGCSRSAMKSQTNKNRNVPPTRSARTTMCGRARWRARMSRATQVPTPSDEAQVVNCDPDATTFDVLRVLAHAFARFFSWPRRGRGACTPGPLRHWASLSPTSSVMGYTLPAPARRWRRSPGAAKATNVRAVKGWPRLLRSQLSVDVGARYCGDRPSACAASATTASKRVPRPGRRPPHRPAEALSAALEHPEAQPPSGSASGGRRVERRADATARAPRSRKVVAKY